MYSKQGGAIKDFFGIKKERILIPCYRLLASPPIGAWKCNFTLFKKIWQTDRPTDRRTSNQPTDEGLKESYTSKNLMCDIIIRSIFYYHCSKVKGRLV